jgi:hypothetical protein
MIRSRANMASTQWFGPRGWSRPSDLIAGTETDNRFANGNNACDGADVLALEPEFNIDISRRFLRFGGTSRCEKVPGRFRVVGCGHGTETGYVGWKRRRMEETVR